MAGFNEGKSERTLFGVILLCCIGGGWSSSFLALRYKLGEWLGVLMGVGFTALLFLAFVVLLLLIEKWKGSSASHIEPDESRRDEQD